MSVLSCGVLLTSPEGWLLAHVTGTKRWDIPKGRQEPNETPLETMLRESFEETNLNLDAYKEKIVDLGEHPYLERRLHLFKLGLDEALDLSDCCCHTKLVLNGTEIYEADQWEWVPEHEVFNRIGRGLGNLLVQLDMLEEAKKPKPHKKSDLK